MTAEELYVRDAFLGALMLTGNIEAAEHAVLDAITTSECGVAMDKLLVTTAKFAIQVHDECPVQAELLSSNLPVELQRLLTAFYAFVVRPQMFCLADLDGTHSGNKF